MARGLREGWFGSRVWYGAAVAALLVLLGAELLLSVRRLSKTVDEGAHLYAGYQHWRAHDFGVNPEHPPMVKLVAAAPLLSLDLRQPHPPNPFFMAEEYVGGDQLLSANDGERLLRRARSAAAVFTVVLALLIWAAGYEMFGPAAGLLGLALFVLEPTVLAHGALVTTDMGVSACLFAAVYAFFRYARRPGWGRLAVVGIAVGLTLAAKMSGVIVLPILLVCALLELVRQWEGRRAVRLLGAIVFAAVVGYGILWAFYGFRYGARTGGLMMAPPLGAFAMGLPSAGERSLVMALAKLHLLPEAYLYGWTKLPIDQMRHPMFLFGRVYPTGRWFYFPAALVIKTSFVLLVLLLLVPVVLVRGGRENWRAIGFLAVPTVLIVGASMTSKLNIGVRHVLPVYPFALVLAGAAAWALARRSRVGRYAVLALVLFDAVSSLHAYPNYLAYSNEIFGGPDRTYRVLSDSNADWGQELKQVGAYLTARHVGECWMAYSQPTPQPLGYGIACKPLPSGFGMWIGAPQDEVPARISGVVLIAATEASGQMWGDGDANPYRQFQEGRPKEVLGGSVLVYEGTYDVPLLSAEAHASKAPMLLRRGQAAAALAEAQEAVALAPDSATVEAELGGTLLRLGRSAEAEAAFGRAVELAKAQGQRETDQVRATIAEYRRPNF